MEPTKNTSNKKIGISIAVILIVAIIALAVLADKKSSSTTTDDQTTEAALVSTTPLTTASGSPIYKDGTYTATGSYMSPGGLDHIAVTLTLKSDVITDASVAPQPGDKTSAKYQAMFADNYKQYVVGKDITTLAVGKVSGSSLTAQGFNDAVSQIETQAKA